MALSQCRPRSNGANGSSLKRRRSTRWLKVLAVRRALRLRAGADPSNGVAAVKMDAVKGHPTCTVNRKPGRMEHRDRRNRVRITRVQSLDFDRTSKVRRIKVIQVRAQAMGRRAFPVHLIDNRRASAATSTR